MSKEFQPNDVLRQALFLPMPPGQESITVWKVLEDPPDHWCNGYAPYGEDDYEGTRRMLIAEYETVFGYQDDEGNLHFDLETAGGEPLEDCVAPIEYFEQVGTPAPTEVPMEEVPIEAEPTPIIIQPIEVEGLGEVDAADISGGLLLCACIAMIPGCWLFSYIWSVTKPNPRG